MRLAPGTRIGAYEVVEMLGAGGMGEVYRARDTRLGREVAIKVLLADQLADDDRRRRFVQEARTLSTLNHPHIVTIYEIESAGDLDFVVMELVRGKALDAQIPRRGLPPTELLRIGTAMADALAAAHARGIIHRDLKPANVIIGVDGTVKVLDFGLAKLIAPDQPPQDETATDVRTRPLTALGSIAGTPAYMSPEQASGGTVDARSDIFSFGAVLYEMATGTRAFAGDSVADTLAAVLQAHPAPPTQIATTLPRELERLILRCVRKDPVRRYQSMLDVRNELLDLKEEIESRHLQTGTATPPRRWRMVIAITLAALLLGFTAIWVWQRSNVDPSPMRVLPLTGFEGFEMMPTISPDGEQVAFAWNGNNDNVDIYVTAVGSNAARRLTAHPTTEYYPSWSPDGKQIAFVRRLDADAGLVYLTSPLGGDERKLSDFPVIYDDYGAFGQVSWSPDGNYIVASPAWPLRGYTTGIYLLPVRGGEPRLLISTKAPATARDAVFSPDGQRLAYLACDSCCYAVCDVMTVEVDPDLIRTASPRQRTSMGTQMQGLAWTRDSTTVVFGAETAGVTYLWRVNVDTGDPPQRLEAAGVGAGRPAAARSRDRLVFARSRVNSDIYREIPSGSSHATIVSSFLDWMASYSPDGRRIAFVRGAETTEVWVADADGSAARQLTRDMGRLQWAPRWAPNSRTIAFVSFGADRHRHIWTIDADGANLRQITSGPSDQEAPTWSRDGQWIYFSKSEGGGSDIWRIPVAGGHEEKTSAAGGFLAYESVDGHALIYSRRLQQAGQSLWSVSIAGGTPRQLVPCLYGFSVASQGIYYYPCRSAPEAFRLGPFKTSDIRLIDWMAGERLVGTLNGILYGDLFWGPQASADGSTFLYGKLVAEGEDLMVIENFR